MSSSMAIPGTAPDWRGKRLAREETGAGRNAAGAMPIPGLLKMF
jgi:hypothetical protein